MEVNLPFIAEYPLPDGLSKSTCQFCRSVATSPTKTRELIAELLIRLRDAVRVVVESFTAAPSAVSLFITPESNSHISFVTRSRRDATAPPSFSIFAPLDAAKTGCSSVTATLSMPNIRPIFFISGSFYTQFPAFSSPTFNSEKAERDMPDRAYHAEWKTKRKTDGMVNPLVRFYDML